MNCHIISNLDPWFYTPNSNKSSQFIQKAYASLTWKELQILTTIFKSKFPEKMPNPR